MKSAPKTTQSQNGAEPSVNFTPVPVVIFLLVGILFYLGQLYLDHYGGGFNGKVYGPYDSWKMVENLQPKGAGDIVFAQGRKIYDTACLACHQGSGMGSAGIAPPLAGSEWVLAAKPDRLVRIAHLGVSGPITVKGVAWNMQMPGMGRDLGLSDEDMAALLTYIRGNKEWGNNASVVTTEQVKAARDPVRERQTQITVEELSSVPDQ